MLIQIQMDRKIIITNNLQDRHNLSDNEYQGWPVTRDGPYYNPCSLLGMGENFLCWCHLPVEGIIWFWLANDENRPSSLIIGLFRHKQKCFLFMLSKQLQGLCDGCSWVLNFLMLLQAKKMCLLCLNCTRMKVIFWLSMKEDFV